MPTRSNIEACRAKCKLICNTCYVDLDVLTDVLVDHGIDPDGTATANNADLMLCAILVVKGWAETSRSEGGISTSINYASVKKNILFWCNNYGLNADELLGDDMSSIDNGSNLW